MLEPTAENTLRLARKGGEGGRRKWKSEACASAHEARRAANGRPWPPRSITLALLAQSASRWHPSPPLAMALSCRMKQQRDPACLY